MCGIAGMVDWGTPPDTTTLRAMEQTLAHRGPDESRIWHDQYCGLAHTRLRVIDLSPIAAQPMTTAEGNLEIVFNGEIYNFKELRKQLEALGHLFTSQSDTEVVLRGYEEWGEDVFAKLRGMFALAIWNLANATLVLARDPFGKKPLFFSRNSHRFAFASELPTFRRVPGLKLSLSTSAYREYLEFGYVQGPRTILNEVEQMTPGHVATLSRGGLSSRPYSTLLQRQRAFDDIKVPATEDSLDELLHDAVARRLVSDVPLGCFLSGGIDSSLIAAHAQQCVEGRLRTFTVAFKDSAMDESRWANAVARHLGTDHHEVCIKPESITGEFESILTNLPEPLGDDSYVPTFIISRATRREVTVALSGDGGDELFCGYSKYRQFNAAQRVRRFVPAFAMNAAASLLQRHGSDQLSKTLAALSALDAQSSARWLSTLWKGDEVQVLLEPRFGNESHRDFFSAAWERNTGVPSLERFMLVDLETYLPGDILTKVDRASMAHGLEVRSPFLDDDLVSAVLRFRARARPGKPILQSLLARRVPPGLLKRPKQGFGMPINEWYRGPLRSVLERYTAPERVRARGLLDPAAVQQFVAAHLSGNRNYGRKLHALVAFEIWSDQFFGGQQALA